MDEIYVSNDITKEDIKDIETKENSLNLRNDLWDAFDKMNRKDKLNWLLEFECIFDTVKNWDDNMLKGEIQLLKEKED